MVAVAKSPPPLPRSLLFLCDRNSVRSPFAAAAMRARVGDAVRIRSAGVAAADETDTFMIAAAAEDGLDLSAHHPRSLAELVAAGEDLSEIEMIVALSRASERLALDVAEGAAARVLFWPVPDPSNVGETRTLRLAAYRDCCARILNALDTAFPA